MGPDGFMTKLNVELAKQFDGALVADLPTEDEWGHMPAGPETNTALSNGQNLTNTENDLALNSIAHYNKASGGPQPVGLLEPNAWGLYDMLGNMQEWTKGATAPYWRGGSWHSKAAGTRSAARIQKNTSEPKSKETGFRLVLRFRAAAK